MRLTYRGIQYNSDSIPLETKEGEVAGKYRGQPWHYHYPRHIPQLQPKLLLNYRGVSYSKRPTVRHAHYSDISIPTVTANGELPTPQNFTSKSQAEDIEDAHLSNMRRNLERRLSVAKQNGDDELVSILEKEYQQLTVSQ